ncbi:hypothetical protein DGo_PE0010 (plasmid) [Deinococcus gobiensis I-0]|uniref:Uncharacterized protein n=1 Tax=Deinococcus gobiensis (strain DSM 21396 / JCM 16679 / CGMCC 1.7299 / I-0) TaxID=745776 RepID=H8H3Q7_DEIGI|nr:hypothetical protein DGo_PE0010 [Deinococcus gobiensis I-0]
MPKVAQAKAKRSIPTPVGNANTARCPGAWASVHPHACGERGSDTDAVLEKTGPSPRLWGTRMGRAQGESVRRSIPTPVGNACNITTETRAHPVHPHACGERKEGEFKSIAPSGPSPRLWGTRLRAGPGGAGQRSIPTPVGNAAPQA